MKKLIMMVLGLMCAVGMAGMAIAGNIDSPGPPSSGSGMYTLQQVYNYLSAGTTATIPGSFQEPSAGPGSTMKTTKEIVAAIATPFAQCDATAANVESGKKFFSTASGNWGVKTGTLVVPPTPMPPTPTPTWYEQYGPSGSGDVVKIGAMYVATKKTGPGCAANAQLQWDPSGGAVATWSAGLNWCGRSTGWRIPNTKAEHCAIWEQRNTAPGFTYETASYWINDTDPNEYLGCDKPHYTWQGQMLNIPTCNGGCNAGSAYVRAVRTTQ